MQTYGTSNDRHENSPLYASSRLNVKVENFVLEDNPASITINLSIAEHKFYSKITYQSIPSWQQLWKSCNGENVTARILGAVVAWDCMRFLSLGGEELILCEGLELDEAAKDFWRYCFLNQFGEWRYLNNFFYHAADVMPRVVDFSAAIKKTDPTENFTSKVLLQQKDRWLLANGGGKDTLAAMLLLNDAKATYDVYEGYLPIGGTSWELQASLLANLRDAVTPKNTGVISVNIQDDFFSMSQETIDAMNIEAKFFKADFAVGHTANYPGYFPIILYHGYSHVWFNIEASADRGMAFWNGEYINHQWCKSESYQNGSTELLQRIMGSESFKGFFSTLRGLNDIHIYTIANSELLKKTHSCNYDKPWCRKCPKCCFSYLMMCSIRDESFALEVIGGEKSLFTMPENMENWFDLLDPNRIAWECVPSHEECLIAVAKCIQQGMQNEILNRFRELAENQFNQAMLRYMKVNWEKIPLELREVTLARLEKANIELSVPEIAEA